MLTTAIIVIFKDLEERIKHLGNTLPPEPSAQLVSGGETGGLQTPLKLGLSSLQRSHASLQQDLLYLKERVARMANIGEHLLPLYAGEQELQLRVRKNCVLEAWRRLCAEAEQRARLLNEAILLHRFLQQARVLLVWMEEKKEEIGNPNGLR